MAAFENRLNRQPAVYQELANRWYTLDENDIPACYVLKKLNRINDEMYWKEALPVLLIIFDGIQFDKAICDELYVRPVEA